MTATIAPYSIDVDNIDAVAFAAITSTNVANTSIDGVTWSSRAPASATRTCIVAGADTLGNQIIIAPTISANTLTYSYDGVTWTTSGAVLPSSVAWRSAAYGGGTFVLVASGPTANGAYSTDGLAWSGSSMPASRDWYGVGYGNGYFVAVARTTDKAARSSNGSSWDEITLTATADWRSVAWGNVGGSNGTWVALGYNSTTATYSTDNGATWNSATLPATANWSSVTYGNGTFVAVAYGSSIAATSVDGSTWVQRVLPNSRNWSGVAYNQYIKLFAAIADTSATGGGTSPDGITWTARTTSNSSFVAVCAPYIKWRSGDTLTISNGSTVTVSTDQYKYWSSITITNGKLRIANSSTSTPITFAMGKLSSADALTSITPSSGLGSVEVSGNWIELGTSNGAPGQTFTSPYSRGDYIPALWVETGLGTDDYELWLNVTGFRNRDIYNYYRNGLRGVGSGGGGKCFTQSVNDNAVKYIELANCTTVTGSDIITCTSTTGLVPGTWVTGRDLPAPAIVQKVINATTFTIHAVATTGRSGMPIIGVLPTSAQYGTTLTFGNDTYGAIPPAGMRIRVPNIMITDISSALFNDANFTSATAPAMFVGTNGGSFTFDTCLFGESYSNYTQAQRLTLTDCGFAHIPYVSECYQLSLTNVGFGLPPVVQYLGAPTALGATGSCTGGSTTVTIPSSVAVMPGMLITGTGLHACLISSITNDTTLEVSTAAHTNSSSVAYSYYGLWTVRDMRMTLSATQGIAATMTAIQWTYISSATFNNVAIAYGGHLIYGANSNSSLGSAISGAFNIQYSNDVVVDGLKIIQLGSYPRTRPYQQAITTTVAGTNCSFSNVEIYNMNVLAASAVNGITVSGVTHRPGINREGYNWASACKVFTDPANNNELQPGKKYWFKTRSYRSHNFDDTTNYVDGLAMCGVIDAPARHLHPPRYAGALPHWSFTTAAIAYGNGYWVALNSMTGGGQNVIVSENNGVTWTTYMLPATVTTASVYWRNIIWCPTQNLFMAIGGGGAASTLAAYSYNGKDWSGVTTAPASAQWQALAFDNSQATNKWVGVAGGSAASTAGTYATITNGSIVFAASVLASAQWIDVASNGAGRYVAIAGGSAVGTATAYSTNGSSWTSGGANASSLWQSIAYGSSKFVCISASATNGPTAYSTDATSWTAGTAPTLPTGMNYNKIIWTGSVFVILAGPTPLNNASALTSTASQCYATSSDGITWSALAYLPDYTSWISCANNGNAVGFISTQTGRFAYTPDITAGSPTWYLYSTAAHAWNRLSWYSQLPEFNPTAPTVTSVATTLNSTTVTCTSTAGLWVGAVMVITNAVPVGAAYLGTGAAASQTYAVIVTSITNATTFVINKPATRTASGLTGTFYKHCYQLFRSTTAGFTTRDETTLIGATVGTTSPFIFDDVHGVMANTVYYYRIRKLSGYGTLANCSGSSGVATITTSGNFYNWRTSTEMEGITGTNVLFTRYAGSTVGFYGLGIVPGCVVTGTGIPAGTTVISVDDFNSITLSANLTSNVNARGSSITTVGFSPAPGMYIYGSNVGLDCKVVSVDSSTSMTVSINNTNTFTNQTLTFVNGFELPELACVPQLPLIVQNNALQSTTLATTWTASNITATNAAALGPLDNFVGINAAAPASTACSLRAAAANGTLTQSINVGVGQSYTFSVYARARCPNNYSYIQMKLDLGTTTQTFTLTNKWTRYSVSFTTTASTHNAVITVPARGTVIEVQQAMVTLGSTVPPTTPANTTTPTAFAPQQTLNASSGLVGYLIDGGAGVETTLNTAPTGQFFAHLHVGTEEDVESQTGTEEVYDLHPSDLNQVYSTESPAATDVMIGATTAAANITVDNYQPVSVYSLNYAIMLTALSGASGVIVANSTYAPNGTTGYLYTVAATTPSYNISLHNIDLINPRSYIAALYQDGATANNSNNFRLQNIRSSRGSRFAWNGQGLGIQMKNVAGLNPYPPYNAGVWNLNSAVTTDSVPLVNTAVYDSMFKEMSFGSTDGAFTWQLTSLPSALNWIAAAYNGTVWCAIASSTRVTATSTNGINWTSHSDSLPAANTWKAVASNGAIFVAVASGSRDVATSSDGIVWTNTVDALPSTAEWSAINWNGTNFAVVAEGPSTAAAYSNDGTSWSSATLPSSAEWIGIASIDDGTFCAISNASTAAAVSTNDGQTWSSSTAPSAASWTGITSDGEVFAAISSNSKAAILIGSNWTEYTLPSSAAFQSIAWTGTHFIAVAANSQETVMSQDGTYWFRGYLAAIAPWEYVAADATAGIVAIAGGPSTTSVFSAFSKHLFGRGCLHLCMIGSSSDEPPYETISGSPYFSNAGDLYFTSTSDQIVIEWPHYIKGITGFDRRLPHIYGTDVGLDLVTSLGVLVEYDLDKGSGYSGSWKRLTSNINNLASETGIDPFTGVRPKFRLTARKGLKYTGQSSQFVIGETVWNASSNPSATAVVVDDEVSGATTTGTLIVDTVTGSWGTGNTIYSTGGTTRATITATNSDVFFPQPTSRVSAIRLFTFVDGTYDYAFYNPYITVTGLKAGSEVRVFRASDNALIAGIENSGTTWTAQYDYYEDVEVFVMIIHINYIVIRLENQILGVDGLTLLVQQQTDRQYAT